MASANSQSNRSRRHEGSHEDDVDAFQAQTEQWSRRLGESAQHIWWAGLGALQRAQAEGSRLFDSLVQEGAEVERDGRQRAEARTERVREEVESRFDQARESMSSGWNRIERAFDDRLRLALRRLDMPERAELDALRRQVQSLRSQVSKLQAGQRAAQATSAGPDSDEDGGEPGPTVPPGV